MKTILREFRTDIKQKLYTRYERGHIIGSDKCRGCYRFIGKLQENEKINGAYTFVTKGVVECLNMEDNKLNNKEEEK